MKRWMTRAHVARINQGADTQAPEWVLLFAAGWNSLEEAGGEYLVDRESYDRLMACIVRRGIEIVWDYEHQTLSGGKAPAAGWTKEYRWSERGIEARVEWTEEARGLIAKKEYRYFSPVFWVRKSDHRLVALQSVALTNTPKTNRLQPLLAKLGAQQEPMEDDMDFLKKLIEKLGLAEDADEEAVLAALDARAEELKTAKAEGANTGTETIPTGIYESLGLAGTENASVVVASINALKQAEKSMVSRAEFQALQGRLAARDAADAVAAAMKAGKITPDQKEWAVTYAASDPEGFAVFAAKAVPVVPLAGLSRGGQAPAGGVDHDTMQVAKLFGNSEDDLKKFGGITADA